MVEKINPTLKEARHVLNYLTGDEELKRLAELREKWEFEYNWDMSAERKAGIKSGIKTGIKTGKKQEKIQIAKQMLKKGSDIEFIADCTGLSKEEILKLNSK